MEYCVRIPLKTLGGSQVIRAELLVRLLSTSRKFCGGEGAKFDSEIN